MINNLSSYSDIKNIDGIIIVLFIVPMFLLLKGLCVMIMFCFIIMFLVFLFPCPCVFKVPFSQSFLVKLQHDIMTFA